uniref:Titin n=1 Tax=Sparus aurata TaxID=8175 RepID=A0A671UGG7_SPAAU
MQFNTYSVLAGKDLKLEFPLLGRPKPKVAWTKDGQPLKVTSRVNVVNTPTTTGIQIGEASKEDFGKYSITATNTAGTITEDMSVIILDKPGPPKGPLKVIEVSNTFVHLSWEPPEYMGGCQVKNYIVEKRDTTTTTWQSVTTQLARTAFKVTKLKTGAEYQFRIIAENRYGKGASLDSKSIVVQYPYKPPGPPGTPYVKSATKEMMIIEWNEPVNDGGSTVIGYHLESKERKKRETSRLSWTVAAPNIKGLFYKLKNLLPANEYIFRVRAVNKYGAGEFLESEPIIARNPYKPPSAPGTPEASQITKDSMVLSWTIPEQTGGADIESYHLEKRDKDGVRWTKCNRQKLTDTHFKVTGLLTDHFYEFRVAAENEAGMGDLSELSLFYRACNATTPPGPPHHPKVTDYTKSSVSLSWGKPAFDGGAYIKGYIAEVDGEEYQFRVCAINSEGVGEAANVHSTVITSDRVEAPEMELDADLRKVVSVRAGGTLRLFVTIRGRPEPAVKWEKVEGTLTERAAIDTTSSYTMLVIDNVNRTITADIGVIVLDKPGPPKGIKVDAVTSDSITLSWSPPDYDGGCSISNYIVEKRDTNTQEWQMVGSNVARTAFKAGRLTHGAEYQFRIYAVNRYGKSTSLDSPGITAQYNFRQPGPPSTPIVKLATKSYMLVIWNEPVNDGGSPVLGYHLERKERTSILWTKMNRGMIKDTEYKVNGIEEGMIYEYRVYAENIAGIGKCSKACEGVAARDPCDPPGTPVVNAVTRTSVSLSWDKPEYDGGAKVSGYTIERRDLPEGRWTRCNFTNVPETHYDVTGLTENSQYDFRVIAKNAAGLFSIPSDNTGPITVTDDVDPPRIMMDVKFRETVFVKAGETLKINADLAGRPAPVISWTKDGKEIELRARIQVASTDTSTSVIVKDCIRRDSGQYALTLQNIAGTVTMPINCVILDKPGPSAGPLQITGLKSDECTLSWGPPHEAGGADITHYVVEKRETSRLAWTMVKGDITKTHFKVTGLLKGNEYIFRVLAVNKHGLGEALESEAIKITDPYTVATAPAGVDVTTITGDSMTLNWCKPASDGGSPVTGYVIERREKTGMRWVRVNRDPVVECTAVATKLRKGCEYDFRVYAENAAGLSPPSEQSATFRALDPLVVASRPTKPKIVSSTKDSVSIVWKPPTNDGGARILGYSVEYREHILTAS